MRADLLLLAADLSRRGEAFALATVVRRDPPSSSRVGDAALITGGGAFHGWLGGSCTQPTVVREALQALAEGAPRVIALTPDPESDRRPDVAVFPMTCHSGGSVDIYIEPILPPARVVVFGVSPVAQAVARLAKAMGFTVDAVDPAADRATFPETDEVFTTLDGAQLRQRPGLRGVGVYALVATMGQRDEEAVLASLALEPGYLGVVASRRRFAQLREMLLARGAAAEALDRVHSPAGLDIGARRPEEIALSILAEMVQLHPAPPAVRSPDEPRGQVAQEQRDPVCGMTVRVVAASYRAEHGGRTYYFCCGGCRSRFLAEPERYAASAPAEGAR